MLLKCRSTDTGHIVEIQITLERLMAVKLSGGHSAYKLARTFGFFKKEISHHVGALTDSTISKVASGILRGTQCPVCKDGPVHSIPSAGVYASTNMQSAGMFLHLQLSVLLPFSKFNTLLSTSTLI